MLAKISVGRLISDQLLLSRNANGTVRVIKSAFDLSHEILPPAKVLQILHKYTFQSNTRVVQVSHSFIPDNHWVETRLRNRDSDMQQIGQIIQRRGSNFLDRISDWGRRSKRGKGGCSGRLWPFGRAKCRLSRRRRDAVYLRP